MDVEYMSCYYEDMIEKIMKECSQEGVKLLVFGTKQVNFVITMMKL